MILEILEMSCNPTSFEDSTWYPHPRNLPQSQHLMSHDACKAKRMRLTYRAIQLEKRALLGNWHVESEDQPSKLGRCPDFSDKHISFPELMFKEYLSIANGLDISNPSTNGDRPSLGSETIKVGEAIRSKPEWFCTRIASLLSRL